MSTLKTKFIKSGLSPLSIFLVFGLIGKIIGATIFSLGVVIFAKRFYAILFLFLCLKGLLISVKPLPFRVLDRMTDFL